jgi:hypothetical protein
MTTSAWITSSLAGWCHPRMEMLCPACSAPEGYRWLETRTVDYREALALGDEGRHAYHVYERERAAGPGREANTQDGAEIGISRAGDNLGLKTVSRLESLDVEKPHFEMLDVRLTGSHRKVHGQIWP